ncbi:MAG: hypothetical protein CMP19_10785 [Rickettsiales bacterium]|nr:hypothetical protein [Rickettsiales bacterium]|tara:strand:- start:714 stop:983 length:270 start_codon:yes stop_codon:yes gene_type:complete
MNTHYQQEYNQSMADKSSIATYIGGGISAFWGFLASQEFGIVFGVLVSAVGLSMNYYFKRREDKRQQAEERRKRELHEITLKAMKENDC